MRITIQSLHFDADVRLKELIENKLKKLETFHDRITEAEVYLKLEKTGQVQDKIVEVRLAIPQHSIVASETSKTFEHSLDEVLEVLKRQLKKHKDKLTAH